MPRASTAQPAGALPLRAGDRHRSAPSRRASRPQPHSRLPSIPPRADNRHRSAPHGRTAGAAKGAASSPAGSCGSRRLAAAPPRRHTLRRPTRAASAPTRRCAGQHQHPERKQPPTLHDSIEAKSRRRPCAAHALHQLPLQALLDRHHGQRTRDRREPPLRATPYAGRTVGSIYVRRAQVFDPDGNWFERAGNNTMRSRTSGSCGATCCSAPATVWTPRSWSATSSCCARARLPLRCGHRADTRSAGHLRGTRRGAHARQLDHQCRRLVPGRGHDVRSLRRQHPSARATNCS